MRIIYQPVINLVFSLSWPKLRDKYTEGYDERRGAQSPEKIVTLGNKRPIWLHGVSVGEVQAAVPLIKEARGAGYTGPVIISTTTETGKAMAVRLGSGLFDIHIYYPWDKRLFVCSALDTLNPWAFITTETEIWPNMLWELKKRNIPAFLINGRISDRSWKRLGNPIFRAIGRALYGLFTMMFLRDARDVNRLRSLGIEDSKLYLCGDSKIDALLARKNPAAAAEWADKLGCARSSVFVAGSTHTGEDEIILAAFALLTESVPGAKLIIVPRHPDRAPGIAAAAAEKFSACLMSELAPMWDVLVVDSIGVLFDLYGIAAAAFVGGSLVDKGGQNILEPASWGIPIQYGPHMEDFAEASAELLSLGIASRINDSVQLAGIWIDIALCKDKRYIYSELSEGYFASKAGAAKKTWEEIKRYS